MSSKIEWTDEVWNPTIGCSHVSPGCDRCYAARQAHRGLRPEHAGLTVVQDDGTPMWNGDVRFLPERLRGPLAWKRPRRIFVDSMSDLFHPRIGTGHLAQVWAVMAEASWHSFQVLTKRPQRAAVVTTDGAAVFRELVDEARHDLLGGTPVLPLRWPLPNVWLGTSIEDDAYTWRARHLQKANAAVRFVSAEPLLGPLPSLDVAGLDWLIVGGESGPGARPMHPAWARDLRDRAADADVPFLFKQWGEWWPSAPADGVRSPDPGGNLRGHRFDDGQLMLRLGKGRAGRLLDGVQHDGYPAEIPTGQA